MYTHVCVCVCIYAHTYVTYIGDFLLNVNLSYSGHTFNLQDMKSGRHYLLLHSL